MPEISKLNILPAPESQRTLRANITTFDAYAREPAPILLPCSFPTGTIPVADLLCRSSGQTGGAEVIVRGAGGQSPPVSMPQQDDRPGHFGPLGIYANSVYVDSRLEALESTLNATHHRKYELLRAARELIPGTRTANCRHYRILERVAVKVRSSPEGRRAAHFWGVETCNSVWACPVCASKICTVRRAELRQALDIWRGKGGHVRLLTQTFAHTKFDNLKEMLTRFKRGRTLLYNRSPWRKFKECCGVDYWISAMEVRLGKNGWHVHVHSLLFVRPGWVDDEQARSVAFENLSKSWREVCLKAGLGIPNEHGLDLRNGDAAADYIGKWGLDCEMTSLHTKRGTEGSRSPWDLLSDYVDGDKEAGSLWAEFALAFKGKRQLIWSPGLRKALGLEKEKTDEEAIKEIEDSGEVIGWIPAPDWTLIAKLEMQGELLTIAEKGDWNDCQAFVRALRSMGRAEREWLRDAVFRDSERVLNLLRGPRFQGRVENDEN